MPANVPFVHSVSYSVVVPTADTRNTLRACLESVQRQVLAPREIVVVAPDGHPRPEWLPQSVIFRTAAASSNGQRNRGARHATGDVVLFVDDDIVLDEDFGAALMGAWGAAPSPVAGMAGLIVNDPVLAGARNHVWWAFGLGYTAFRARSSRLRASGHVVSVYSPDGRVPARFLHGCCVAYDRCTFLDELFDETFDGYVSGGDLDLSARMRTRGWLFQVPTARSTACAVSSTMPADPYWQARRFGETLAFYRWRHRGRGILGALAWEYANLGQVLILVVRGIVGRSSRSLVGYLRGLASTHCAILTRRCRRWHRPEH